MSETHQLNAAGEVAMRYHQPAPILSKVATPSGNQYYFDVHRGVSLAWVKPEDAPALLAKKGGCCGGKRQLFDYANAEAVRVWQMGNSKA